MAPLMVHYLSFEKPWNKFIYLDFRAYAWWKKYPLPANGWKDI